MVGRRPRDSAAGCRAPSGAGTSRRRRRRRAGRSRRAPTRSPSESPTSARAGRPRPTVPRTSCGRPSNSAARTTSPRGQRPPDGRRRDPLGLGRRLTVDADERRGARRRTRADVPIARSSATFPRRWCPKWKSSPTTTALAFRQSVSTSRTNSSAVSFDRASSKRDDERVVDSRRWPAARASARSRSAASAPTRGARSRRVAVEGDHRGLETRSRGQPPDLVDHGHVTPVHAVERPDGDRSAGRAAAGSRRCL